MDAEEKREVYEVARRAVRDEVRAMVHDFVAVAVGTALFVSGLLGVIGWGAEARCSRPRLGSVPLSIS